MGMEMIFFIALFHQLVDRIVGNDYILHMRNKKICREWDDLRDADRPMPHGTAINNGILLLKCICYFGVIEKA